MTLIPLLVLAALAQRADTVRFTPTVAQPTFAVREPVLRIKPGPVLISRTNHGPYYTEQGGAVPGEVGPFFVEGATTSDMLKVEIIKVRPNTGLAASQVYANFGGLASDSKVRMLNDPLTPRRYLWRLDAVGVPTAWRLWTSVLPVPGLEVTFEEWTTLATGARVSLRRHLGTEIVVTVDGRATLAELEPGPDPFARLLGP